MVSRVEPEPRRGVGQRVRSDRGHSWRWRVGRGRDRSRQGQGELLNAHRVPPVAVRSAQVARRKSPGLRRRGLLLRSEKKPIRVRQGSASLPLGHNPATKQLPIDATVALLHLTALRSALTTTHTDWVTVQAVSGGGITVQLSPIRRLALPLAGFISLAVLASSLVVFAEHDDDHFQPGNLVVSRSVYVGVPGTVTVGETLPPGCVAGTVNIPLLPPAPPPPNNTTPVKVKCAKAVADGTYPTVFNNDTADGSFGVTSPIFLDQMTPNGTFINSFAVDSTQI